MPEMQRRGQLRVGDQVRFGGCVYEVNGLDGLVAYLSAPGRRGPLAVTVAALFSDPGFEALTPLPRRRPLAPLALVGALSKQVQDRARWLEGHICEVIDGVRCDAPPGTVAKPEYDVTTRTLRQREHAKVDELRELGEDIALKSLQRLRNRYETEGLLGLVDKRALRRDRAAGQVDERVVAALLSVLESHTNRSSGTMGRIRRDVERTLASEHGPGTVPMPSRATFYRLVGKLGEGRHALGSARTRRTLSQQPPGPFGCVSPVRPGELMQIDSTPFDVAVVLGDGVIGRVELTGLVDVATRSIPAAVLRPTTKAVDAALLLARSMTPEPMRPGWPQAISMAYSALPFQALRSVDERLASAAAKPVIVPETIVCDHGKAYLSNTFRSACRTLGISLQPAHPDTPTDKGVIERTLQSAGTLFAQYVTGYLGSSVERRGKDAEKQAVFSLVELQDLLDEWIVTGWQHRPHEGLRDPLAPGSPLTPNEKYASLLAVAGYVPVPMTAEDFIELLPVKKRAINSYGVRINHRIYDGEELNPYRGQPSGVSALGNLWEVHYDPYDVTRVWVRNHLDGGWITLLWRQLSHAAAPFGDTAWEHARKTVADRGEATVSEDSIAAAVDDLLTRASPAAPAGKRRPRKKTPKDRRTAARTRAVSEPSWPRPPHDEPEPAAPDDSGDASDAATPGGDVLAEVVPLPVFDAREAAKKKWW